MTDDDWSYLDFQDDFIYTKSLYYIKDCTFVFDTQKILTDGLDKLHCNSPAVFKASNRNNIWFASRSISDDGQTRVTIAEDS